MPKRSVSFSDWRLEKLANPDRAAKYLTVSMQDSPEMFLVAMGHVAQANRMAKIAEESGVKRESLYRSLSEQGNPTFSTLAPVLKAMGIRIVFEPIASTQTDAVPPMGGLENEPAARELRGHEAMAGSPECNQEQGI